MAKKYKVKLVRLAEDDEHASTVIMSQTFESLSELAKYLPEFEAQQDDNDGAVIRVERLNKRDP